MKKSPRIQHGNDARIDPKQEAVPLYLTNSIVAKHPQEGNAVPQPLPRNTRAAAADVDRNQK